ncbi:MAG TPA: ABC transporter ATP-binding protein [Syntrophorhabdales bacterium]|nr:ABC transporter ATP-binding protein [Syntrophorhabdales bacterium]
MLELVDVHTYYGENHILNGISLEVKTGSVVALLGRNGMGKTTTVRSIVGFTAPRSGNVRFKNRQISGLPPYQISQMGLALAPQGRAIFPSLSVEENLTIGERSEKGGDAWSLETVYSLFPRLKERARNKGNLLSGGEQQMLCIGRALMTNPQLLLMDEPSEGLAPMIVREIGELVLKLKSKGLSVLLVEQNLSLALRVCDYAYIVSKGEIVYQSTPDKLKNDKQKQNKYLGVEV